MEEDKWGFEVGEEAVLQSPNTSLQLLSPNETRNRRMAKLLALVLVLVLAGVLPLLITILLRSQRHAPPGSQVTYTRHTLKIFRLELLLLKYYFNTALKKSKREENSLAHIKQCNLL